ncbi:MAG: hypothetical protein EOP42_11970 [Sphingobacteriaceae bacterium]|nr:MAG: hypothetical protein EOP42_11970 [Sphingobacteriaceae bacterium]
MKKLLPALLLFWLALFGCSKEKSPVKPVLVKDTIVTHQPPAPRQITISSISPASGTAGMVVAITGTNFGTDSAVVKVFFKGVPALVQSVTNTEIKAVVPVTSSGNVLVTIGNQASTEVAFTYLIPQITISGISPSSAKAGTLLTITGTNFGTSTLIISFNGTPGTVQSVTPTEIKVVVPVCRSGAILVLAGGQTITGPVFTYIDPALAEPYVSGSVTLRTQAEVDAFVALNKGKQLHITSSLSIGDFSNSITDISSVSGLSNITSVSGAIGIQTCPKLIEAPFLNTITTAGSIAIIGSGLTTLSFNNLQSFSGDFRLGNLSSLNHVNFNRFTTVNWLYLYSCPLLTDLSFIKDITTAYMFNFRFLNTTAITMDKLTGTLAGSEIYSCNNLTAVSFKSLTTVPVGLTLMGCPQLSNADFSSLKSVSGKLTFYGTNLTNLSGFSSLQTLGSLTIYSNPALTNLHGLERLTVLSSPATNAGTSGTLTTP